jgi:hypothetical protein
MKGWARLGACIFLATLAWTASAGDHFERAVSEYRAGRYPAAWGHFCAAANEGDADAARVALHLLRYGPLLHGGFWDASSDEVADWSRLAASSKARPPPEFQPGVHAPRARSLRRRTGS